MRLDEAYNKNCAQLNENDKLIWSYLSGHRKECSELTINELADRCCVSRTTILRFSKRMGFKGFSELKMTLRQELGSSAKSSAIHTAVGVYNDVIKRVLSQDCSPIFRLFDQSKNIYVYSTGRIQSSAAHEMSRVFLEAGLLLDEVKGESESWTILDSLTPDDCMIMISCSGESEEACEFAKALNVRGVPTISMTLLRENRLASLSDYSLYGSAAEIPFESLGIKHNTLTGFFILVEMLYMKYLAYKEGETQ